MAVSREIGRILARCAAEIAARGEKVAQSATTVLWSRDGGMQSADCAPAPASRPVLAARLQPSAGSNRNCVASAVRSGIYDGNWIAHRPVSAGTSIAIDGWWKRRERSN